MWYCGETGKAAFLSHGGGLTVCPYASLRLPPPPHTHTHAHTQHILFHSRLRSSRPHLDSFSTDAGEEIRSLSISSDGRFLATGGLAQTVKLWDAAALERGPLSQGVGHSSRIESVCFSADDKQVTSVGDDANIFVWNLFS